MPGDISKTLVSDEDIEKCFGPRSGNKGRNGPKLNNCNGLPQSERINWAGYAKERHRNQLRSSKNRRESKPIGPPILRVHRVYKPPPNLSLEHGETDERAPSPVDRNLKGAATQDAEQEAPAAAEEGISSEPSEVKPKLKVLRSSTKSAVESIALSVGTYKTGKEVLGKLETERTELAARKQSLETRLEDGGFDEENPESLEAEEEDLNLSLSGVLTKIEECSARLLQSQTEMKLSRSKQEELKMELERAELKVDNAQVVLRREEALLAFQKEELRRQRSRNRTEVCQLAPSESMAGDTQSRFLGILDITKHWGPSEGQLTYARCGRLLRDGRPCGLGLRARKTKESAPCSANSQYGVIGSQISSQMGTPVNKSRDRARHICSQSGEEVQLFHFFIETAEPRHELEVSERAGQELLKMTGQEFFEKYGRGRHSLHKFFSTHLASTPKTITFIGKPSTEGYLRVLSCSRAGITSPIRSCFLINPPQPHVGIVQIASDSPDRHMSSVGISSSYNSSRSLAASSAYRPE
ncbi:hypothetical protein R1sor_025511 [Riccia sorocarpa]|uniref:Uncharacterized protein n=1 Tax=Riccia sorocarpa TaxID=122646 RepID=A0ABD3G9C0_9MARC